MLSSLTVVEAYTANSKYNPTLLDTLKLCELKSSLKIASLKASVLFFGMIVSSLLSKDQYMSLEDNDFSLIS